MDFFRKCFLENFFLEKSAEGRRQQHGYRTWIFLEEKITLFGYKLKSSGFGI
jgi:hypothetical protein